MKVLLLINNDDLMKILLFSLVNACFHSTIAMKIEDARMIAIKQIGTAVKEGNVKQALFLVQKHTLNNLVDEKYKEDLATFLIRAAERNDIKSICVLLSIGADPNFLGSHSRAAKPPYRIVDSFNALMRAVQCKSYDAVKILVEGILPPNRLAFLKENTYFALLPNDLLGNFLEENQFFKLQANSNIRSLRGQTPLDLLKEEFETVKHEELYQYDETIALLEFKMNLPARKYVATTLMKLQNSSTN